jgi:hypothetical protein
MLSGKPDQNQRVVKYARFALEVRSSIHLSYRRSIAKNTTSLSFGQGKIGYLGLSSLSY